MSENTKKRDEFFRRPKKPQRIACGASKKSAVTGMKTDLATVAVKGSAKDLDRLDQLEAQSIYIFREAFARMKNLALLWSLGKDSNVMIWLARKAFFGRVPFPVMHVDTGKKFPEMYAFRDRYSVEWDLKLDCRALPLDRCGRRIAPARRTFCRAQDGGPEARARQTWLRRPRRRHPPRRRADARQGTRLLSARP